MTILTVTKHSQPMLASAQAGARQVSECLFGEPVKQLEVVNGFTEVKSLQDGYSGFISSEALAPQEDEGRLATVCVRSSFLLAEADEKSELLVHLPLLARVRVLEEHSSSGNEFRRFVETTDGHFAVRSHLLFDADRVDCDIESLPAIAEQFFTSAPYVWGGKTPAGCDCSGMLQSAARVVGVDLPRDSHQQEQAIEQQVTLDMRRRGDLVFWPGHVGILVSADTLFHANASSMDCRLELLESVIDRAGEPGSIRRCVRSTDLN